MALKTVFPVAVCITYFNEGPFLTECIRSILDQDFIPDSVWVYDDCSSAPASDFIPEGYRDQVRVIRGEVNQGPGFGRNVLLENITSRFVRFADCDDPFLAGSGQLLSDAIASHDPDWILNPVQVVKNGQTVKPVSPDFSGIVTRQDLIRMAVSQVILPAYSTLRTDLVRKSGGYLTRAILPQSEDYEFHVRYAQIARSFFILQNPAVQLTVRENSNSSSNWKAVYLSGVTSARLIRPGLPAEFTGAFLEKGESLIYHLVRLSLYAEAREAIRFFRESGKPAFKNRNRLFKWSAAIFGWYAAERISKIRNGFKGKQS